MWCGVLLIDSNYSLIYDLSSSAAFFPLGTVQAVLINNQTSLKTRNKKGFELVPRAESKDPLRLQKRNLVRVRLRKIESNILGLSMYSYGPFIAIGAILRISSINLYGIAHIMGVSS